MENKITYISVDKLIPHPQNPRKQLGDLTELANSIKHSGVYQNLTVVDNSDGTYTIIIGHRRHAAAKIAGLTELPCIIADMTEHDQLETMLIENMQRSDLTVIEEAQGLQLMIDLGDSVADIASTTGFSKKKIKSRLFLNNYNAQDVEKAFKKGATLEDYVKLSRIKDDKKREEVAKLLGTPSFNYRVKDAIDGERWEKVKPEIIKVFEKYNAVKAINPVSYYEYKNATTVKTPEEAKKFCEDNPENRTIKFKLSSYYYQADVYLMLSEGEIEEKRGKNQDSGNDYRWKIDEYRKSVIKKLESYIDVFINNVAVNLSDSEQLKAIRGILGLIIRFEIEDNHRYTRSEITNALQILGIIRSGVTNKLKSNYRDTEFEITKEKTLKKVADNPVQLLLALLRSEIDLKNCSEFYAYDSSYTCVRYIKLKHPGQMIECLEQHGFETPDELRQYLDGTHRMYAEEGCKEILELLSSEKGG